jgi:hypothetical protein
VRSGRAIFDRFDQGLSDNVTTTIELSSGSGAM